MLVSCLPVEPLLFKKTDAFFYLSTLYLLFALVPLIALWSKFYFSWFLDMKIWACRCARILNFKSGTPWTNLADVWPNCCQTGYLQNRVCEFQFFFSFQSYSLFFTGGGNNFSSPNIFVYKNKTDTFQKCETPFFRQT